MAHVFLSSEWLDAVEVLQSAFPPRERAAPNTAVTLKVTDGPDGDTELTFAAGRFRREAAPNPTATVTIDYEVAKALLVDRDQSVYRRVAMKAFGAGKLKVDGDQSAVAATLSPSPQQVEVAAKIKELRIGGVFRTGENRGATGHPGHELRRPGCAQGRWGSSSDPRPSGCQVR